MLQNVKLQKLKYYVSLFNENHTYKVKRLLFLIVFGGVGVSCRLRFSRNIKMKGRAQCLRWYYSQDLVKSEKSVPRESEKASARGAHCARTARNHGPNQSANIFDQSAKIFDQSANCLDQSANFFDQSAKCFD